MDVLSFFPTATPLPELTEWGIGEDYVVRTPLSSTVYVGLSPLAFRLPRLTHKAVGQELVGNQGVSTRRWAIVPHLWGLLLHRDPQVFSLEPQGSSYHV